MTLTQKYADSLAGAEAFAAAELPLLANYEGAWRMDPEVKNVWGWFDAAEGKVRVIAYLDGMNGEGDFESDEEYFA
jgi:hypothetical protein